MPFSAEGFFRKHWRLSRSSAENKHPTTDLTALPIMNWRWLVFKVRSSFLSGSILWHSILLSFEAIFFMVHKSTCWAVLAGSAFEFMEGDTIWCWVYVSYRRCSGTGSGSKNLQGMFCPYFKTYGQTLYQSRELCGGFHSQFELLACLLKTQ